MKLQWIVSAAALFAATACSDTLTESRSPLVAGGPRHVANSNHDDSAPCKNDGWQKYTRADGSAFNNQGECVSYAVQGGTLVPVVTAQPPVITAFAYTGVVITGDCSLFTAQAYAGITGVFSGGAGVVTDPLGGTYAATSGTPILGPFVTGAWTLTVTGPGGMATATTATFFNVTPGACGGIDNRIPGRKPVSVP